MGIPGGSLQDREAGPSLPRDRERELTAGVRISDWPAGERPRELLEKSGTRSLSEAHLLAVILRTGAPGGRSSALDLGRGLLSRYGGLEGLDMASVAELKRLAGIGLAKAASIKAAFELGRRLSSGEISRPRRFRDSRGVAAYFRPQLLNLRKEIFVTVLLNGRHELIRETTVSEGCLTSSIVHPREAFRAAVREAAAAVLFVHNHPSGDPTPSVEDRRLTERLVEAGKILGIRVLDHVVVARRGYVSLLEDGTAGSA
jgi:DNA repair protein RadC